MRRTRGGTGLGKWINARTTCDEGGLVEGEGLFLFFALVFCRVDAVAGGASVRSGACGGSSVFCRFLDAAGFLEGKGLFLSFTWVFWRAAAVAGAGGVRTAVCDRSGSFRGNHDEERAIASVG